MDLRRWDEPAGAATARGWLRRVGRDRALGFYLDYGHDRNRQPHSSEQGGRVIVWCREGDRCQECEPGTVLAVSTVGDPNLRAPSRYFETVGEAREWVEAMTETA